MVVAVIVGQAARIGLSLDEGAVTGAVTVAAGYVYYHAARLLEERWPAAGVLLGVAQAPSYGREVPVRVRVVPDGMRCLDHLARLASLVTARQIDRCPRIHGFASVGHSSVAVHLPRRSVMRPSGSMRAREP